MREGLRRDRESAVRVFCHYWSTVRPPLSPPNRMIPCMIVHSPYTGTTLSVQSSIDRFRVSGIYGVTYAAHTWWRHSRASFLA